MTILNVVIGADHALIAVDTATDDLGGRRLESTKLYPLLHMDAVIAGRGLGHPALLHAQANAAGMAFDALAAAFSDMATRAIDGMRAQAKAVGGGDRVDAALRNFRLLLVGWSPKLERYACWDFRDNAAGGVDGAEVEIFTEPWGPGWGLPPSPLTREDLVALARTQTALARRDAPQYSWGGRLIIAELTRQGMTIAPAVDLEQAIPPSPPAQAARGSR